MSNNSQQQIVSLRELLDRSPKAVKTCADAMEAKGWVVVELPEAMEELSLRLKPSLMEFFGDRDQNKKNPYRNYRFSHLGFDSDRNRQSLRILTGTELEGQKLPPSFEKTFRSLSTMVDEALLGVSRALYEQLFNAGESLADLGKAQHLPLLVDSEGEKEAKYALIEAAYYNNEELERAENCAEHYDPGLFSLNVLDTQPGLQFQDEHGNWIDAPLSSKLGVLWAGAAASREGYVKAAMHRVVHPQASGASPRLSLWSEICTKEQIFVERILKSFFGSGGVTMGDSKLVVQNFSGGEKYVVPVREGGVLEALRIVQEIKGIPMSKSMPRRPVLNEDGEVVGMESPFSYRSRKSKSGK